MLSKSQGFTALPGSKTVFLFPGQGSQEPKMLESVMDIPEVKHMVKRASEILGYNIQEILQSEAVNDTVHAQPALLLAGLAAVEKLKRDNPEAVRCCQAVAGLSLGEYTALVFAGALSFDDAVALVKMRAEAMQQCASDVKGEMLSVVGLDDAELTKMCEAAAAKTGEVVQIANYLFKQGRVVSGQPAAIAEVERTATPKAMKVSRLRVSGAFHSPLMAGARERLKEALAHTKIEMPSITVYANTTAKPYESVEEIRQQLCEQVDQPVQWEATMQALVGTAVTNFYELGPRDQLKAMMRRIDLNAWKRTVNVLV